MRHDLSRSRRQGGREEGQQGAFSVDLQMSLLNAWSKYGVAEYYQNIFLAHLDQQIPKVVEEKIRREVKQTLQKSNYFFRLEELHNQRHYLLEELQEQLLGLPKDASQEELHTPLRKVRLLRDINLDVAETIIKMHQEYHCSSSEMRDRQLKEFATLIDQLQQTTTFIRASPLSSHIRCGDGFDPFFMNNYQSFHRQPSSNSAEAMRELYSLNISAVYRLMKAKSILSDIMTASEEQTHKKRREREREKFRFQSLPTLHTEHQSISNRNRVIGPVDMPIRERTSRTTVHPLFKDRPESSYTEQYSKPKLKLSKAIEQGMSVHSRSKVKRNIVYLHAEQEDKQSAKKYQFNHNQSHLEARHRQHSMPNDLIDYKRTHPRADEQGGNRFSLRPYHKGAVGTAQQPNKVMQFRNYNPIKGESFEVSLTPRSNSKYDYKPQSGLNHMPQPQYDADRHVGLQFESPISKHNRKSKRWEGEIVKQTNQEMVNKQTMTVDREMQTMEMKVTASEPKPVKKAVQVQYKQPARVVKVNKPTMDRDDEVIEDQDIIDERPLNNSPQRQPLIREVSKQPSIRQSPPKQQQQRRVGEEKRQIKMKVGKLTIKQMLTLLQDIKIEPQYRALFDMEKLVPWIKTSQTYLTEFHINSVCAVVALSSPLPSIGTALKLWAPITGQTNSTISINLFTSYIEYIEKSTTAVKIVYQGNGEGFKELQNAGFVMRKEGLYERTRQLPVGKTGSQFKPFLYVECSSVNFAQTGKQNVIFSQEIEEFSSQNSHVAKFIGSINAAAVPEPLKQLVKISERVNSFKEVNSTLVDEQFDEYEASQVKASNIKLLRLFLNTPLKSTFLAAQGFIKFVGNLLYESGQQCLISLPTLKNNGVLLFSKNMSFDSIQQKAKTTSSTRVNFSVKMFTKKLYGRLSAFPPGSYGNFEVNLTFEDEMQGRIKHNLKIDRCFGPEPFTVSLEVEKNLLFCLAVGEEDFIY